MDSGDIGLTAAIVTITTLLISKLVEYSSTRMKVESEVKIKGKEQAQRDYDTLRFELKEELTALKAELDKLREENIVLQVEKARLEIINETLQATIDRLSA